MKIKDLKITEAVLNDTEAELNNLPVYRCTGKYNEVDINIDLCKCTIDKQINYEQLKGSEVKTLKEFLENIILSKIENEQSKGNSNYKELLDAFNEAGLLIKTSTPQDGYKTLEVIYDYDTNKVIKYTQVKMDFQAIELVLLEEGFTKDDNEWKKDDIAVRLHTNRLYIQVGEGVY